MYKRQAVTLPAAIETAVEEAGFWASIPLWLVTILGSLFITVLSFMMIMSVYGRFFKIYIDVYKRQPVRRKERHEQRTPYYTGGRRRCCVQSLSLSHI